MEISIISPNNNQCCTDVNRRFAARQRVLPAPTHKMHLSVYLGALPCGCLP